MDIEKIKIAIDTGDLQKAKNQLDQLEKQSVKTDKSVKGLGDSFLSFKGVVATIATSAVISNYIKFSDVFTNIESKLRLATKSTNEFATAQRELFNIAQSSRVAFESTVDLYSKLSTSTEQLKISQQDLLRVTETINKAGIIGGGSKEGINAALMQLGQGFASGTLRGEELNSVLEQTPRLAKAIAEGMGVTVGELRKLGEQGSITAEKVVASLLKQSGAIDKEFTSMKMTIGQSFLQIENSIIRTVGQINNMSGASTGLAGTLSLLSKGIDGATESLKDYELVSKRITELRSINNIADAERAIKLIEEENKALTTSTDLNDRAYRTYLGQTQIDAKLIENKVKIRDLNKQIELQKNKALTTDTTTKEVDNWKKLGDTTKKAIDPVRVIRDEYAKLREELKTNKLDTPQNLSALNAKEIEDIANVTKKANQEAVKSQKELTDKLNETSDAYADIAKMGMTEYEQKLYDLKLKSIDFIEKTGDMTTGLKSLAIAEEELNRKYAEELADKANKKEKERIEIIDKRIESINREYDLKEKQVSLLDDENEKNKQLANLYFNRRQEEIKAEREKAEFSREYYDAQSEYEQKLLDKTLFRFSATGQIIESVTNGMKSSMMDFFDYTSDGFGNLKKMTVDLGNMIYKAITQQMIVNPLVNSISGAATSFFASAKGNIFNSPSLSQFSNSVVDKPTTFAFASGGVPNMGIMGEKNGGSPEAIIPLTRTSNGDLGVKAQGLNGNGVVKVEVINNSSQEVQITNTSTRQDTEGTILSIVINGIQNNKMGLRTLMQGR